MNRLVLYVTVAFFYLTIVTCQKKCTKYHYQQMLVQKTRKTGKDLDELKQKIEAKLLELEEVTQIVQNTSEALSITAQDVEDKTPLFQDNGGKTYIRWGRSDCPTKTGAELVYDGFTASGYFSHTGGGTNYLCLPQDPIYLPANLGGTKSFLFGAEYRWYINNMIYNDVPCAVCRTPRSEAMLLPARNECYDKWQLEYHGMLASSYNKEEGKREYVCVDAKPEALQAGYSSMGSAYLYGVESVCGALKCPPYINNRDLTCAVCTYTG